MTILFLTRRFYPQIGGVETHVLRVSEELVKRGNKVIIVADAIESNDKDTYASFEADSQTRYIGDKSAVGGDSVVRSSYPEDLRGFTSDSAGTRVKGYKSTEQSNKIIVYRLPKVKENRLKKISIWIWFFRNRKFIEKADIVHCHDVFFWYLPFRFLYPYKKVFTTFHGYEGYPLKLKNILIRKLSEKLSKGNICVGEFITKWYKTKPDIIIYGGVNHIKYIKPINSISAVFIGRMDEQTNIDQYVKAIKKIKAKYPDFKFLAVGSGKYENKLGKDINKIGFINHELVIKQMLEYRFAFVSRYLSILEAMEARRLVFAFYDNELKRDYLELTPFKDWIIIVNGVNDLYKKIIHIINHPEEERDLVNKAYLWVHTQTWHRVTSEYLKLWDK